MSKRILTTLFIVTGIYLSCFTPASASTEFISTIMQSGGDYNNLSSWESAINTDLTSPTTKVFSGTRNSTTTDNATLYHYRSGTSTGITARAKHLTLTQALFDNISSSTYSFQASDEFRNNTGSITYFTLSDSGDSPIATAKIDGTWSSPDTTPVTIGGWTTTSTNYIKIYTTPAARHQGKWDDGKYRLEGSPPDNSGVISIDDSFVKIDGLQIKTIQTGSNDVDGIVGTGSSQTLWFSGNIIRGVLITNSYSDGICTHSMTGSPIIYAWDNIILGFNYGAGNSNQGAVYHSVGSLYAYNNTFFGNNIGLNRQGGVIISKNNLSYNNNDNYAGTFHASSANNLSGPTQADAPGTNPRNSASVLFADELNKDFHLGFSDTGARNRGVDLSLDPDNPITTDIDGHNRSTSSHTGSWDIGADEGATHIFYAVGQNTSDHKTGTPTVSITNGTATFSASQTAPNIGVGDKITYATTSVVYIIQKISQTQWKVATATGTIPVDVSNQVVNSITHPFSSLSLAESGAEGLGYLNTNNISANNYVLNFSCYYDTGPDTTAVSVSGWITAQPNYIKIYTPNNIVTEVNSSQRHGGKWDDRSYSLSVNNYGVRSSVNHIRIDGLQVYVTNDQSGDVQGIDNAGASVADYRVSNNIVKGPVSGVDSSYVYGIRVCSSGGTATVWNNIVYDFTGSDNTSGGIGICGSYTSSRVTSYVYNNTFYNNTNSAWNQSGGFPVNIFKNNISRNSVYGFNGVFSAFSDYNISDISGNTPNASFSTTSKVVDFVDESKKDFHLRHNDINARNAGVNLSGDSGYSFSTDIDGSGRSNWDIGADEGSVEFEATVMQSGGDYNSLSSWEAGMQTDLTASSTMVFEGVLTGVITDNTALFLCRSGLYQNITASMVHATSNKILVENILNPLFIFSSNDSWHTGTACNSSGYFNLSQPGGNPAIAIAKIDGTWNNPESLSSALALDGWTTGPQNYIKIYTTPAARHTGKWDNARYRIEVNSSAGSDIEGFRTQEEFVIVDGLQIKNTYSGGGWGYTFRTMVNNRSSDVVISNNILVGDFTGKTSGTVYGMSIGWYGNLVNMKIYNNIQYYLSNGSSTSYGTYFGNGAGSIIHFYNNTFVNSGANWCVNPTNSANTFYAYNNIVQNCSDGFGGSFDYADYNISDIAGDTAGISPSYRSGLATEASFVNEAGKDFHLTSNDVGARNQGTNLSSNANLAFTSDIDNQSRPFGASWDIGADEYWDTSYPVRSNGSPTTTMPLWTTSVTLSLNTDENATCKYGMNSGTSYASLPYTFSTTGTTTHSTLVSGLQSGTYYTYYIRCQDQSSNANPDDYSISFLVDYAGGAPVDLVSPVAKLAFLSETGTPGEYLAQIITNEPALCRHSFSQDISYKNMTGVFQSTGGNSHRFVVSTSTIYFVKCADVRGNEIKEELKIEKKILPELPKKEENVVVSISDELNSKIIELQKQLIVLLTKLLIALQKANTS